MKITSFGAMLCRMVADPFEMARHEDEVERRLDGRLVLEHVGQATHGNLRLERVEPVVFVQDMLGQIQVVADEGVERVPQHVLRDFGHHRDVDQLLDGGCVA
jgi:hypothetical protein